MPVSVSDPRSARPSYAVPDQTRSKTATNTNCTPRGPKDAGRTRQTQETSIKSVSTGGSSSDLTKPATSKTGRQPSPNRPSTPTTCNPAELHRQCDEQNNCETNRPTKHSARTTTQSNSVKTVGHGTTSNNTRGRVTTTKIPSTSSPGKQNRSKSAGADEIKRHLSGSGALRAFHDVTSSIKNFAMATTPVVMAKDRTSSAGRKLFSTRLSLAGGGDHQLLPDYRPLTKARPPNCLRSFSIDCSSSDVLLAGYEFDDESVPASFTVERFPRGDTEVDRIACVDRCPSKSLNRS